MVQRLDASFKAQLAERALGVMFLVELEFESGTIRATNFPLDVTVRGVTWTGVGAVASIDPIRESEDGAGEKLSVGLSQVPAAYLAAALGRVEGYQGRAARVYVAVMDATTMQIVGAPLLRFSGYMDLVRVEREEGGPGKVVMELVTFSGDARANASGLRLSNSQHQSEHPGERGFEYVTDLIGKPALWLSKTFQRL